MIGDIAIDAVLLREGGFVDDPDDPGGATKFGITARTLAEWRGRAVTTDDVRFLAREEAAEIYRERYLLKPGIALVTPERVQAALLDAAVQFGPRRAIACFQRALRVRDDGMIGAVTLQAMRDTGERTMLARLAAERVKEYARAIVENPRLLKFARGWFHRAATFIEELA